MLTGFICVIMNNHGITFTWEEFLDEQYRTHFTDITMLTRGLDLCRKEHYTSVINKIKKYYDIKITDFVFFLINLFACFDPTHCNQAYTNLHKHVSRGKLHTITFVIP
jgi:hypothetical protein